ncbi:hypothetical protein D3C76_1664760 [compost metagenome]
MDDTRRHLQVTAGADRIPLAGNNAEQVGQGQLFGLVVHLQRADAGGEVDHAG